MIEAFEYAWNYTPNEQSYFTWLFWLLVILASTVISYYIKRKKTK